MSVDALSATNSAPSDAEIKQLSDLIAAGADDFTKATQDLESATRRVNALERELGRESRQHDVLKGIASPLRRLPPELVAEFFSYCAEASAFIRPDSLEAPLLLGQISSAWRDIALGSPKLWSRLELVLSPANYHSKRELSAVWLERAASIPVALSVQMNLDTPSLDPVEDFVAPHAPKLRRLSLSVPARCIEDFLTLPKGLLGRLDTLAWLRTDDEEEVDLEVWAQLKDTSSLDAAPRLATLTLKGEECHIDPQTLAAPWVQLTNLIMSTSTTRREVLALLCMCPALVKLSVGLKSHTEPRSISEPAVTHLRLQSLQLTVYRDPQDLMSLLTLPELNAIAIVGALPGGGPFWCPIEALSPLVARSGCVLTSFATQGMNIISTVDLVDCLETLPKLEALIMEASPYLTGEFWKALIVEHEKGDPAILPSLRKLWIDSEIDVESEEGLMDMVESRWCAGTSMRGAVNLEAVNLAVRGRELSRQTLNRIERLARGGLNIGV